MGCRCFWLYTLLFDITHHRTRCAEEEWARDREKLVGEYEEDRRLWQVSGREFVRTLAKVDELVVAQTAGSCSRVGVFFFFFFFFFDNNLSVPWVASRLNCGAFRTRFGAVSSPVHH